MGVFGTGGPPGASFPREEWGKGPSALWPSTVASFNSCLVDRVRKGGEAARGYGAPASSRFLPDVSGWRSSPFPSRPPFVFTLSISYIMRELGVRDGLGSQGGDAGSRRLDGILRVAHGCATSLCVCDFCLLRDLGRCPLLGFSISTSSRFALPVVEWSRPERSLEGAPGL